MMKWYLVHTKPRQEHIALLNLQQQGYSAYLPMISIEKLRGRKLALVKEPLFPRYLFVQLDTSVSGKSWMPVRNTIGVSKLVCFGVEPARIDDGLIEQIRQHETGYSEQPESLFAPGDRVVINSGPFQGVEAVYQMPDGDSRVIVLFTMLNKPVRMGVNPAELMLAA